MLDLTWDYPVDEHGEPDAESRCWPRSTAATSPASRRVSRCPASPR